MSTGALPTSKVSGWLWVRGIRNWSGNGTWGNGNVN